MDMILQLMKINKVRRYELSEHLGISQPTLKIYLNDPMMFSVRQVVEMSKVLNYPSRQLLQYICCPKDYCLDELRAMVEFRNYG